jgi:hypothetical protein
MEHITPAQDIYLKLIEASGHWNSFDGPRIAGDLRAHTKFWRSAIIARQTRVLTGKPVTELGHRIDLLVLRDLPDGLVNLDQLFLLAEPAQQDALEQLARGWSADECVWIPQREAFRAMGTSPARFQDYTKDEPRFLLSLWWD